MVKKRLNGKKQARGDSITLYCFILAFFNSVLSACSPDWAVEAPTPMTASCRRFIRSSGDSTQEESIFLDAVADFPVLNLRFLSCVGSILEAQSDWVGGCNIHWSRWFSVSVSVTLEALAILGASGPAVVEPIKGPEGGRLGPKSSSLSLPESPSDRLGGGRVGPKSSSLPPPESLIDGSVAAGGGSEGPITFLCLAIGVGSTSSSNFRFAFESIGDACGKRKCAAVLSYQGNPDYRVL